MDIETILRVGIAYKMIADFFGIEINRFVLDKDLTLVRLSWGGTNLVLLYMYTLSNMNYTICEHHNVVGRSNIPLLRWLPIRI